MHGSVPVGLDVVIFGGGAAGLWLLDDLHRAGYRVLLLEAHHLGSGQTVASQGIIHGGLKYSLRGRLTGSARAVREMPMIWRRCLAGERDPDLSGTRLRAEYCHLWQTSSLSSWAAMVGARAGLRTVPERLERDARPPVLRDCPGVVARIDEQVVEPDSFLENLADRHQPRLRQIDVESGLEMDVSGPGEVRTIRLLNPESGEPRDLHPQRVVFSAGRGNDDLRRLAGLPAHRSQRRPLHMVVIRGNLPVLNGHCVDGLHTRATITTSHDYADRIVWQVGGQIAEAGVGQEREALIQATRRELEIILPGLSLAGMEWGTYRVDRVEAAVRGAFRPEDVGLVHEGTTMTAWPTKLALVPQLTARIRKRLPPPSTPPSTRATGPDTVDETSQLDGWPSPPVAATPWEETIRWSTDV